MFILPENPSHRRSERDDALYLGLHAAFGAAEVDVALHVEKIAVGNAEISGEAERGVGRDLSAAVEYVLYAGDRDVDVMSEAVSRDAERGHEFLGEDLGDGGEGDIFNHCCFLLNQ